jgi:hypothetical protein
VKKLLLIAALLFSGVPLRAVDIPIAPTGPNYEMRNLVWGSATNGGVNNNFWFSPLFSSGSVCVYIHNNNTTSAHPVNVQITVTGSPEETTPSDGNWNSYGPASALTVGASPSPNGLVGAAISGAVLVSVNISGSTTLTGSPETANVTIAQTANGNCMVTSVGNKSTTNNVYNYAHMTGSETLIVKATPGTLHTLVFNAIPTTSTYTITDSNSGGCINGTVIAALGGGGSGAASPVGLLFDVAFNTGLCIVISGGDLTVSYQ